MQKEKFQCENLYKVMQSVLALLKGKKESYSWYGLASVLPQESLNHEPS
jgi:hypothetical protein